MQEGGLGEKLAARLKGLLEGGDLRDAAQHAQRCQHQLLGLHTLTAIVAADESSHVASRLEAHGVLAGVLSSLGEGTVKRLQVPAPLRQPFMRLTEAHLVFLSVRCRPCLLCLLTLPPHLV